LTGIGKGYLQRVRRGERIAEPMQGVAKEIIENIIGFGRPNFMEA